MSRQKKTSIQPITRFFFSHNQEFSLRNFSPEILNPYMEFLFDQLCEIILFAQLFFYSSRTPIIISAKWCKEKKIFFFCDDKSFLHWRIITFIFSLMEESSDKFHAILFFFDLIFFSAVFMELSPHSLRNNFFSVPFFRFLFFHRNSVFHIMRQNSSFLESRKMFSRWEMKQSFWSNNTQEKR